MRGQELAMTPVVYASDDSIIPCVLIVAVVFWVWNTRKAATVPRHTAGSATTSK